MMNMTELNDMNFEREVTQAGGPVLVDFHAPWCGPCKMLAPVLETLAGEYAGRVKFAKVNVDDAPELAGRYNITGVPTLMLFRGSEPVDQVVGFPGTGQLKLWLDAAAKAAVTA